jgi:hypothetical protein
MGADGWRWVEMGGDGCRWVQMGGDECRWVEIGGDECKWVQMGGDWWRWVEMGGDEWMASLHGFFNFWETGWGPGWNRAMKGTELRLSSHVTHSLVCTSTTICRHEQPYKNWCQADSVISFTVESLMVIMVWPCIWARVHQVESRLGYKLSLLRRFVIVPSLSHSASWVTDQSLKKTPWSESASELYRLSDRRLSAKWLPTFADRGVPHGQRHGSLQAVFSVF